MLTLKKIRRYCNDKAGVTEDFPFDTTTLVFKVGNKIFLLTNIYGDPLYINLKCDPFLSLELRGRWSEITPGYHMNKKHWNTVCINGKIPDKDIYWLIDHSYELVFKSLKKAERESIPSKQEE